LGLFPFSFLDSGCLSRCTFADCNIICNYTKITVNIIFNNNLY
jgi:hypothetical protein